MLNAFTPYDFFLWLAVSLQATVVAYVYRPESKAMVLMLPFPFTFAALSLGLPVDATNILGLFALLFFCHAVRVLHCRLRVPIVPAIVFGVAAYCVAGWLLAKLALTSNRAFWLAWVTLIVVSVILLKLQPHVAEPGRRTLLPVWVKLPIVTAVVVLLVLLKRSLLGFITTFPMVAVVAAYESRSSLWTFSRSFPMLIIISSTIMCVCRLTQERLGLVGALMVSWIFVGVVVIPLARRFWLSKATPLAAGPEVRP